MFGNLVSLLLLVVKGKWRGDIYAFEMMEFGFSVSPDMVITCATQLTSLPLWRLSVMPE
jgi:hypothetical protein